MLQKSKPQNSANPLCNLKNSKTLIFENYGICLKDDNSNVNVWQDAPKPDWIDQEESNIKQLFRSIMNIQRLEVRISELEFKIAKLNAAMSATTIYPQNEEVFALQEIDFEAAKKKIAEYFKQHDGKHIDYNTLYNELRIDLRMIIAACDELESEGKIG
jgi:hypothetical protein